MVIYEHGKVAAVCFELRFAESVYRVFHSFVNKVDD